MKMNVKKGDTVEVISGKDKGVRGRVLKSIPQEHRIIVEGVAIVKKAMRPNQQDQTGGITEIEAPIDVSNVMLVCPKCGKTTRVGHDHDERGNRLRVCKKCDSKF